MHYYKILKHKAGFDEAMTDWEKIFTHYIADTDKHVIFGPLPLTFKSDGGTIHWTVYGKAPTTDTETGTLPLTCTTHTAGNADDWVVYGNDNIGKNLLDIESATIPRHMTIDSVDNSTGSIVLTAESGYTYRGTSVIITNLLEIGKTYEITLTKNNATPSEQLANAALRRVDTNTIVASVGSTGFTAAGDKTFSYTHTQERAEQGIYFSLLVTGNSTTGGTLSVSNLMIREATTSATFEPYQVGVGEPTKNLVDLSNVTDSTHNGVSFTVDSTNGTITANRTATSTATAAKAFAMILPVGTYIFSCSENPQRDVTYDSYLRIGVPSPQTIARDDPNDPPGSEFTLSKSTTFMLHIRIQASYDAQNLVFKPMIRKADTTSDFIPYGYQIPITVSQQGQSDKNYNFYIGDSPLTEGETISKTSTGVDLELFDGENTVSTTLYNKPETSITYTDYLGVGEYVNGQWQIPLTISHITDNLFDKNAHDTANGFIDNKKVYWDGLKQYSTINDNNYFLSEYMPVTAGKGYYPTDIYYYDALKEYYSIFFYTADKQLIDVAYRSYETVTPAPENAAYMRVCVAKNKADSAMMTTKPTSEYIPHKQSTDYTVPIDAPLTEGQSVSDTVEITAYEGTNTLDTTLTVKPDASITYEF